MKNFIQRSLWPKSALLTEEAVNSLLTPIYPPLWRTIMEPWMEFLRYREMDPNFSDFEEEDAAQFMHSLIKPRMLTLFDGNQIARARIYCRKPTIVVPDQLAITIKKLRKRRRRKTEPEELTRSHYDTIRQRKYWNDEPVEDGPSEPRIIVGYLFQKNLTKIRIVVAYPRVERKGFIWSYLMPEQPASILRVRSPGEFEEPARAERGFTIEATAESKEGTSDE